MIEEGQDRANSAGKKASAEFSTQKKRTTRGHCAKIATKRIGGEELGGGGWRKSKKPSEDKTKGASQWQQRKQTKGEEFGLESEESSEDKRKGRRREEKRGHWETHPMVLHQEDVVIMMVVRPGTWVCAEIKTDSAKQGKQPAKTHTQEPASCSLCVFVC